MLGFGPSDLMTNRAMSSIPISIGTSLALESLFTGSQPAYDPERVIPNMISVEDYQEIWINIETLFRNIHSSVEPEIAFRARGEDFADVIMSEIDIINNLFQTEGHGACKPQYYSISYETLKKKTDSRIKFRTSTTEAQKFYSSKVDSALKTLHKQTDKIFKFDSEFKSIHLSKTSSMIMTHFPLDLLQHDKFFKLDLLESHTGILKSKKDWNTKLYPVPDKNMKILPFIKKIVLLFGDKTQIQPIDIRLRRQILEIGESKRWTPMTTEDKVVQDLGFALKEPLVYAFIKNLK